MPYYRSLGSVPPKRHTQHRDAAGKILYEELIGADGFSSDSALLYHQYIPAAIVDAAPWAVGDLEVGPNNPLRPRHFRLHELFEADDWKKSDPVTSRRLVLGNSDVRISYVVAGERSPLYRNSAGDECVYIEAGSARVQTIFGELSARRGDFIILPRGVTHQWFPSGVDPLRAYIIEANSHVAPASRYLTPRGQLMEHSPYCERDLRGPAAPLQVESGYVEVLVKHAGHGGITGTRYTLPHHPFDVVGWDGCLYPYTFNVNDFEPITGRVHQPPPAHQVFEGANFVVCVFVPRKVDYHPLSIPSPYYHSNIDSDEVMFYCGGDYRARAGSGIGIGSVSLHPSGCTHGPQPGAYEGSIGVDAVDEYAVMIDTFHPLGLGEGTMSCEDHAYMSSWLGSGSDGK